MHGAHAGALDDMRNGITSQSAGWLTPALNYALWIAGIAGVTGGVIAGVKYYSEMKTWEGSHYGLVAIVYNLIPVIVALKFAAIFLPVIFSAAASVSTHITGVVITGPDSILDIGKRSAGALFAACVAPMDAYLLAHPMSIAGGPFGFSSDVFGLMYLAAFGAFSSLTVLLAFAIIAFELLVAIMQILFVATIGSVQIGWAAAPGTQQFAAEYWASVLRSFFRVVITYAVASFLSVFATKGFALPMDTTNTTAMYATAIGAFVFSIGATYIAVKIPHMASEAFSGRPVLTAPGAAGHVADNAAKGVKAAAGAFG